MPEVAMLSAAVDESKRATRRITTSALVCASTIYALTMINGWADARLRLGIPVAVLLVSVWNVFVNRILVQGWKTEHAEYVRSGTNLVAILAVGRLSHWSDSNWLWPAYLAVLAEGALVGRAVRLGASCAAMAAMAAYDGTDHIVMIGGLVLALLCFVLSTHRMALYQGALEDAARKNVELDRALHELRALHEAAVRQDRLSSLGMLAAGLAHEITNPMCYVTANVNTLADDLRAAANLTPELVEGRDELIPAVLEGVKRVNGIVSDLRRFARGDSGPRCEFDLNHELASASRIARARFGSKVELKLELGDVPELLGRPQQIAQVAVNLLVNAAQAIVGSGKVTLRTCTDKGGALISVSDDGAGMDEATRNKLFQPFFTTKGPGDGTGIGMMVVQGIVKAHGGNIEVESALGRGTTFRVWLPAAAPEDSQPGVKSGAVALGAVTPLVLDGGLAN